MTLHVSLSRTLLSSRAVVSSRFVSRSRDLGLVAAGFSGGQPKPGVGFAPNALIEAGLIKTIRTILGYNVAYDGHVHHYEDLAPEHDPEYRGMKNPRAVSAATHKIASQVYDHARQGRFVLTLGGDHSICMGTLAGTAKANRERLGKETAVIYVDAHADINTPESSGSGNIHGMPLAFITGLASDNNEDTFGWIKEEEKVLPKNLVYIGLRDLDENEKKTLCEQDIKAFSMMDVERYGIGKVIDMALSWVGSDIPIHLSFDIDSLDPIWAPSTGVPVDGGLTLREGNLIAQTIFETGQLVALDLVEVNPSLGTSGADRTIDAGISVIKAALGSSLL